MACPEGVESPCFTITLNPLSRAQHAPVATKTLCPMPRTSTDLVMVWCRHLPHSAASCSRSCGCRAPSTAAAREVFAPSVPAAHTSALARVSDGQPEPPNRDPVSDAKAYVKG